MRSRASKSQKVKKVKKGRIRWTMNSGRRPYQLLFDSNSIIYLYLTPDTWTLIYSFPNPACPERSRREPRHSYNILSHVRRLIFDIWFARCWIYIVYSISDIINRTSLSLYRGRSPTSSTLNREPWTPNPEKQMHLGWAWIDDWISWQGVGRSRPQWPAIIWDADFGRGAGRFVLVYDLEEEPRL